MAWPASCAAAASRWTSCTTRFHALGSRVLGFSQELFDDSAAPADAMGAGMLAQMATEYPYITQIVQQVIHDEASVVGTGCDDQWEFEFALDLLLDGLERLREAEPEPG